MTKAKKPNQRERDIDDIGRILAALLDDDRDPRRVVGQYVTQDLAQLTLKVPIPLRVQKLIGLQLDDCALIRTGGGGIVIQCVNRDIKQLRYALKVTRPSLIKGTLSKAGEELSRSTDEYLKHAPLSHANVARVFGAGELNVKVPPNNVNLIFRPILMEWIEGARPLAEYLAEEVRDWRAAIEVLAQSFDGLYHLHTRSLIHWDVKSENILVDIAGIPKVTDIGNARRSDIWLDGKAYSTRRNLPPELLRAQQPVSATVKESSRRTPIEVPGEEWDSPWLDLWMLARELNRLFAADDTTLRLDTTPPQQGQPSAAIRSRFLARTFPKSDPEAQYALRYIQLVLLRLLIAANPADSVCYHDAQTVSLDLRKLFPAFGAAQSVEELQAIPQKVLRLPRSGNAPYTARFAKLYNSPLVRRATRHLQLGTLVQVYPGGSHRRSEHIAGVVATTAQYVRALYADQTEPFWRLAVDRSDVDAVLLAALLHDVGHMAFGHALEEMAGLFSGRAHEDYALSLLCTNPVRPAIQKDRLTLRALLSSQWVDSPDHLPEFLAQVAQILRPDQRPQRPHTQDARLDPEMANWLKIRLLHAIIDSAIDADKLDYLLRDAHHCGVKYGEGVDTDRFFQALCPVIYRDAGNEPDACVGVTEKGTLPVESLLVARYQMFMSVYWHHTARAHTAMLQYAVQQFIGTDAGNATRRVEGLSDAFRTLDDPAALAWLRRQLIRENGGNSVLVHICDALEGARERAYWPAFELRYERAPGDARHVADTLTKWADALNRARDPGQFVQGTNALRDEVATLFSAELKGRIVLDSGEVLVDIPPPGKDQVENIWIWLEDSRKPLRPIQDLSPLADAVSNAFQTWARRLRIFLAPSAWDRLRVAGIDERTVHDALWRVLLKRDQGLDPQGRFDFDPVV